MLISQVAFNAGEIDPELDGRTDIEPRARGCRTLENFIPTVTGPVRRRGGSRFMQPAANDSASPLLQPFEFNKQQAYVLEFSPLSVRVWVHDGLVAAEDGSAYSVETPFTAEDLPDLWFCQSADVLFIAHGKHRPKRLSRYGHDDWRLDDVPFEDGPYMDQNSDEDKKMAASATSGTVTVTASGTDNTPFADTDVGRHLRLRHGNVIGWGVITEYVSETQVKVEVKRDFSGTSATWEWRLGAWSETTGWPQVVLFIDESLAFAATDVQPQTHWKSTSDDLYDFSPTNESGEVLDSSGYSKTLGGDRLNAIRWMTWSQYLIMGTSGGEWRVVTPMNEPIKPTNGTPRLDGGRGSSSITPVRIGAETVFVQEQRRQMYGLRYSFENDGLTDVELTKLCRHVTASGVRQLAHQRTPESVIWAVREDGQLVSMTYEPSEQVLAAARHILGGRLDDGHPVVESAAVIPGDGRDVLWLAVRRTVNGQTRRCIERMEVGHETGRAQEQCFFLDCGATYEGEAVREVPGFDHLEGETVEVLADGATHRPVTVEGGKVVLDSAASVVHAGYGYRSVLMPARQESMSEKGPTQGRKKRIASVTARLHESLGLKYGPDEQKLSVLPMRSTGHKLGAPPPLFTGDAELRTPGTYNEQPDVCLVQDAPLPLTVLALYMTVKVGG
ncbi:phage tail protein [Salidesulfovibrio brasiliensis]|uniref:hypothetical protein n=1 Tax=Salidesulfovibrio brasiliensis TaxID=221711 RepID=UPI0006CF4326|nr:hypothetical protein [Salidesulfovibrio brasiliensis]